MAQATCCSGVKRVKVCRGEWCHFLLCPYFQNSTPLPSMADIRGISGWVLEPRRIEKKHFFRKKQNKIRFKKICKKSHYPPRQKSSYKIVLSSRSVGFRLRNLNAANICKSNVCFREDAILSFAPRSVINWALNSRQLLL